MDTLAAPEDDYFVTACSTRQPSMNFSLPFHNSSVLDHPFSDPSRDDDSCEGNSQSNHGKLPVPRSNERPRPLETTLRGACHRLKHGLVKIIKDQTHGNGEQHADGFPNHVAEEKAGGRYSSARGLGFPGGGDNGASLGFNTGPVFGRDMLLCGGCNLYANHTAPSFMDQAEPVSVERSTTVELSGSRQRRTDTGPSAENNDSKVKSRSVSECSPAASCSSSMNATVGSDDGENDDSYNAAASVARSADKHQKNDMRHPEESRGAMESDYGLSIEDKNSQEILNTVSRAFGTTRGISRTIQEASTTTSDHPTDHRLYSHQNLCYVAGLRRDHYMRLRDRVHMHFLECCHTHSTYLLGADADQFCRYLNSDYDMKEILEYAFQFVYGLGGAGKCASSLPSSSSPSRRKACKSERLSHAMPQPPKLADPVTTISVPRPSFAGLNSEDGLPNSVRCVANTVTTMTVISGESITEITWLPIEGIPSPDQYVSSCLPPVRPSSDSIYSACPFPSNRSYGDRSNIARESTRTHFEGLKMNSSRPHRQSEAPKTNDPTPYEKRNFSASHITEHQITSLPVPCKCAGTNDWIRPPTRVLERDLAAPHNIGIDSHCVSDSIGAPDPKHESYRRPKHEQIIFQGPSFVRPFEVALVGKQSSDNPGSPGPSTQLSKRLGSSIGSASGRRRSSQHPKATRLTNSLPTLAFKKLRSGSVHVGHALVALVGAGDESGKRNSSKQLANVFASTYPLNQGGREQDSDQCGSLSAGRIQAFIKGSELDAARAKTGASGSKEGIDRGTRGLEVNGKARGRRDTCYEDGRPHSCQDDHWPSSPPPRLRLGVR